MVGLLAESGISGVVKNNLSYTVAVTEIDECHATHLSDSLHPSGKSHCFSGIGETQLAACIGPVHDISIISTHKINNFPVLLQIFPQEWIVYDKFL